MALRAASTLTVCALAIMVAAAPAGESPAEGVPADAARQVVSERVTVYHWRRAGRNGEPTRVYAYAQIAEWPDDAWGAEITLTPIPLCCGAKVSTVRWRKSQAQRVHFLTEAPRSGAYRIGFRFR